MESLNKDSMLEVLAFAKTGVEVEINKLNAKIERGRKILNEVKDIPTQDRYRKTIADIEKQIQDLEAKWKKYDDMIFFSDFE